MFCGAQIKSDVETQGDFIRFLIKEVKDAAFTDIEDVVAFVKWLDDELSFLVGNVLIVGYNFIVKVCSWLQTLCYCIHVEPSFTQF